MKLSKSRIKKNKSIVEINEFLKSAFDIQPALDNASAEANKLKDTSTTVNYYGEAATKIENDFEKQVADFTKKDIYGARFLLGLATSYIECVLDTQEKKLEKNKTEEKLS